MKSQGNNQNHNSRQVSQVLTSQIAIDWLEQQTYKNSELDDFIVSIEKSPEKINAILDFIHINLSSVLKISKT
jgi:hypothetical protein